MSELERLQAEADRWRADRDAAQAALDKAEAALLAERFRDVPHFELGDYVLVRRKLFGRIVWSPARVVHVHLEYIPAEADRDGEPGKHWIGYTVQHRSPDGSGWNSANVGYAAREVRAAPADAEWVREGEARR